MALSAAQMQEAVIKNLPEKTGKSLEEWIGIAHSFHFSKNIDILKKLKTDYGLGHVQAQTVVWRMQGEKPYVETEGYEENIFKNTFGLYSQIKSSILDLSPEIMVKPCKSYIPFYRNHQFAILTEKKGELILGLNLNGKYYEELMNANKLGGSERINKMLVVKDNDFGKIKEYIEAAIKNN